MRYRTMRKQLEPVRLDPDACGAELQTAPLAAPDRSAGFLAPGVSGWLAVRESWVSYLTPHFPNGSCYFTGTYSDEYGFGHALMCPENVQKDFRKWLKMWGISADYICAVEKHRYRDILHLHAVIAGDFSPEQLRFLKNDWGLDRGFARSLPVLDGCVSYVTKYALKDSVESFDWRLTPVSPGGV